MSKNILFIGYNYKPELTGIGKYSGEMVEWLANKGYHCSVVTAYPYYPQWKVQNPYKKNRFWYKKEQQTFHSGGTIQIYRCPMYIPNHPTSIGRILLDISFLGSAFLMLSYIYLRRKFDFVLTIAPAFHFGIMGVMFKKLSNTKHFYHIQDLQIETAKELKMIKSKILIDFMFKVEAFIFKNSNTISTISPGMSAKIKSKCKKEVYILPNWVDVDFFKPLENRCLLKENFGFSENVKIIIYSGAIGEKQGFDLLLNSALHFHDNKNIQFVICGTGPTLKNIVTKTNEMKLTNVHFFPLQPQKVFNSFLNMADVHLVIQKPEANDLVMPSKLTTILSVGGLALVTADPGTELYNVLVDHKMGLVIQPNDLNALNEGIHNGITNDHSLLTSNARNYAIEHLSINSILNSYENKILLSRNEESRPVREPIGEPVFIKNDQLAQ